MRNLPDAVESRKESKIPAFSSVEMAHKLVPRLEGVPKVTSG
jgi:hypothetical protein